MQVVAVVGKASRKKVRVCGPTVRLSSPQRLGILGSMHGAIIVQRYSGQGMCASNSLHYQPKPKLQLPSICDTNTLLKRILTKFHRNLFLKRKF